MSQFIGSFLAVFITELIIVLPTYYILKGIFKKYPVNYVVIFCCIIAIFIGCISGYRITANTVIRDYHDRLQRDSISNNNGNLSYGEWIKLSQPFKEDPDTITKFRVGAAKLGIPPTILVSLILIWMSKRRRRTNE